jgi:hypothetical protein
MLMPLLIIGVPLMLIALALLLVFRGHPGECGDGRVIDSNPGLAFAYDQRWIDFNTTLTSGLPATLDVTESEATSRAELFLDTASAPVDDVRVCFVEEGADVNGTLSTPFGWDVDVRLKGNVDLSGRHPEAELDSVRIGALPAFVTHPFRGLVSRIVDDQMDRIEMDHRLSVELQEGRAIVSGQP